MRLQVTSFQAALFFLALLSPAAMCAADGQVVQRFYNDYPFLKFQKFIPQDGQPVVIAAEDLVAAIEGYQIAVKQKLSMKLETTRIEGGLRFILRWDEYSTNDHILEVKLKPESRACFEKSDIYRCFILSSFRKQTLPHEPIEDQQFSDSQSDYFLEKLPDGTLRVLASCYGDDCNGVEWE